MRAGINRAEGTVVTSVIGSDLILLQRLNASDNITEPRLISATNLLAGGAADPNLVLGASGTAGSLTIYPATAAKGTLKVVATNNTGNTLTEITNAAMGQASTISIPDPGTATANFVLSQGAATIAGVKTFSSNPLGLSLAETIYLGTITALAGQVTVLFTAPYGGTITAIYAGVSAAFTSTNIVITPSITHVGTTTAITGGAVTILTASSALGTTGTATPSAANTFVAGDVVSATITGGVGTVNGTVTLLITRTA
jgi:hypothetical protein